MQASQLEIAWSKNRIAPCFPSRPIKIFRQIKSATKGFCKSIGNGIKNASLVVGLAHKHLLDYQQQAGLIAQGFNGLCGR